MNGTIILCNFRSICYVQTSAFYFETLIVKPNLKVTTFSEGQIPTLTVLPTSPKKGRKKNSPRRRLDFHLGPGRAALPHRERGFVRGRRIDRRVATPAEGPRPARWHQCVQTAGRRLTAHRCTTLGRADGGRECGSGLAAGTESAGRAGGHCVGAGAGTGGYHFGVACGREGEYAMISKVDRMITPLSHQII